MLWSHQAYMYSASSHQQEVDWSFSGDLNSHYERTENLSSPPSHSLSLPENGTVSDSCRQERSKKLLLTGKKHQKNTVLSVILETQHTSVI